ncbi:phage/plasmid primase, P4 family [Aurantimonas sp. VKM B-3413]|uniref:phage/plasmid primase, P4 family n=1 Tax=Aurantimonas sp. VKM B-3413 TaxID=2779401 RepID=UPI001E48A8F5|nr:phage/plasmid primase, P4 family [Aurantimonas sp. VKM B-3413]MCB8839493.1 phage/plasmid primase, P4 family [Aurantimonas sp. VKM B-3413]
MNDQSKLDGLLKPSGETPARVHISKFGNHRTTAARRERLSKDEICQLLMNHRVGPKEGSAWSPAIFTNDRRANGNAEAACLAVLDLDHSQLSPKLVARRLREKHIAGIISTTWSHCLEDPCMRVVVFPRTPWRAADYASPGKAKVAFAAGLRTLAKCLGLKIDLNALDPARLYFLPRHQDGATADAIWVDGGAVDVWPASGESDTGEQAAGDSEDDDDYDDPLDRLYTAPEEIVRSAITATRNDARFDERRRWLKQLAAIQNTLGEAGRDAAEEWSKKWEGGEHDDEEFARTWNSLDTKYQGRKAGIGTILAEAKTDGWVDPRGTNQHLSQARCSADERAAGGDIWAGVQHANRLRGHRLYESASRCWWRWTGFQWTRQTSEQVAADAKETSAQLLNGAAGKLGADASEREQRLYKDLTKLHRTNARQQAMVEAASSEPGMAVGSPAVFDVDLANLALPNGILNLRTGQLNESPASSSLVSKLAGTRFIPGAVAPLFDKFLQTALPNEEIRSFVQRTVGYTLTGYVDEECFFALHGTGANGKSVFGNILHALLGDYATTSGPAMLTRSKSGNEGERLVAGLPGKRISLVNETAVGDLWDSERMKTLASREPMTARSLYREPFVFMPTAKIWLRTNHLPGSLDAGDGFWRRMIAIPFARQVPPEERIPDLDRRIIESELPGVLNWALEGARKWFDAGHKLNPPNEILAVVNDYREETDVLGMWIEERTKPDINCRVPVQMAWQNYKEYCEEKGISAGSGFIFSRAMTSRGMERSKSRKNGRQYQGFRLRWSWPSTDDNDDEFI